MGRWSGAADLSPEAARNAELGREHARAFALHALQLACLLFALHGLEIEAGFDLDAILPVIGVGYLVHAWLPAAWKLPLFLALSCAGFLAVIGPAATATLLALGLALIGICHLPVRLGLRIAALLCVGGLLAALRAGALQAPWSSAVLPLLGSLFLFRLAIYLYDEHTTRRPASVWMRLSYFFLLPNVCFLLFPVVDYRTFQRTYFEQPASRIHERGIRWILRGVLHLLAYRVVYSYWSPDPFEIVDLRGVVMFAGSSFLLYLRISGHFHLVVGFLHLFGFHLPETNYAYWLSTSFSDCWRRTNIYWTEFMKKLVYFPAYMRLRKRGPLFALVVATLSVFVVTWLLHVMQWFWLQGELPLLSDGLFWAVAGALALASVLVESRGGARAEVGARTATWRSAARGALRAALVFVPTAALWSLWSSPSLGDWLDLISMAKNSTAAQVLALCAGAAAVLGGATVAARFLPARGGAVASEPHGARAPAQWAACVLLAALGVDAVPASFGPKVELALAPLLTERRNEQDREHAGLSYYDRLVRREEERSWSWGPPRFDPDDLQPFARSGFVRYGPPPLVWELAPLRKVRLQHWVIETNRYGMRDVDYELEKPPHTFRIAILGTCAEMGVGVDNAQIFDALLEQRLTQELGPKTGRTYEVLNFSAPGAALLNQAFVVRERVMRFAPDVVVLSNHVGHLVDYLRLVMSHPRPWPEELAMLIEQVGVTPEMSEREVRQHVAPGIDGVDQWALSMIALECSMAGAIPVYLEIPDFEVVEGRRELKLPRADLLRANAIDAGFQRLSLGGEFDEREIAELTISELGHVPNPAGHRWIARRLYEELVAQPRLIGE